MNFEFSEEQLAFEKEVNAFLDEHDDPDVFDVTRENMAQIVDTPERRAFMGKLAKKGWLGITWPAEIGGGLGNSGRAHPAVRDWSQDGGGEPSTGVRAVLAIRFDRR